MTNVVAWLKTKSRNIAPSLDDYPYISANGTCKWKFDEIDLNIDNVYTFKLNSNEDDLRLKLVNFGPLAIAIYVNKKSRLFQNYESGVFYDDGCPVSSKDENQCEKVNHAVLLVGYGTSRKLKIPYFIIKNSWVSIK